jgi:SNF2 family DNA or RNA helicase
LLKYVGHVLQGLNGILADEMGLGKTIQAMAFLGHLAEVPYNLVS